jgi:hypothetical protein
VGVDIGDGYGPAPLPGCHVAKEMPVSRFVPSTQDHGHRPGFQDRPDNQSQGLLGIFQGSLEAQIPDIKGSVFGDIDIIFGIPGRQPVKEGADFVRSLGGPWPAVVAAYAFVLGIAKEHGPIGTEIGRVALPAIN